VTALSNGNYVVVSNFGGLGAVSWADGTTTTSAVVSAGNSLVGSSAGDYVGGYGITALTNGNYVARSPNWNGNIGAATWADGTKQSSGTLSASNSWIGTTANDSVGVSVAALSNGNYVVASENWNNLVGAATWGNGAIASSGVVSASNSRVGSAVGDFFGLIGGFAALSNGNYVVASYYWNFSTGVASWGNGATGASSSGAVSANNSLVGAAMNDRTGEQIVALSNGNYVVGSQNWNNVGAATWGNGATGSSGPVSASHSLIGTSANDLAALEITALSDGNYVVKSPQWGGNVGAVTLANGAFGLTASVQPWNSVIGSTAGGGQKMVFDYDVSRKRLAVGRPGDNIVSLFTMDQIFASGND